MKQLQRALAAIAFLALPASCSGSESHCTSGMSIGCVCTSGQSGAQVCQPDGSYGACVCSAGMQDGGVDAQDVSPSACDGPHGHWPCPPSCSVRAVTTQ